MHREQIIITRRGLYEQVWAEPMTKLARKYGMSDVGLAKVCRKHQSPRPPRGYWAKLQAGRRVQQTPLPGKDPDLKIHIVINFLDPEELQMKKRVKQAFKQWKSVEKIIVPDTLRDPHPLVKLTAEILESRELSPSELSQPPLSQCLNIQVSKANLLRALRIMDSLIKGLEKRGWEFFLSQNSTMVRVMDLDLRIALREQLVRKRKDARKHSLEGYYSFGFNDWDDQRYPSGNLSLELLDAESFRYGGTRQTWREGEAKRLEDLLDDFAAGLLRTALRKREHSERNQQKEKDTP